MHVHIKNALTHKFFWAKSNRSPSWPGLESGGAHPARATERGVESLKVLAGKTIGLPGAARSGWRVPSRLRRARQPWSPVLLRFRRG